MAPRSFTRARACACPCLRWPRRCPLLAACLSLQLLLLAKMPSRILQPPVSLRGVRSRWLLFPRSCMRASRFMLRVLAGVQVLSRCADSLSSPSMMARRSVLMEWNCLAGFPGAVRRDRTAWAVADVTSDGTFSTDIPLPSSWGSWVSPIRFTSAMPSPERMSKPRCVSLTPLSMFGCAR